MISLFKLAFLVNCFFGNSDSSVKTADNSKRQNSDNFTKNVSLNEKMDVFVSEESNIDIGREKEDFSTWSTLATNPKKYVKIFDFKINLKRHGFLCDKFMDRPRKIYLIDGTLTVFIWG